MLISFDRMMLVNHRRIGDCWKTVSNLINNSRKITHDNLLVLMRVNPGLALTLF